MIERTFVHLSGIGEHTERRLWLAGIGDWAAFRTQGALPGISRPRKALYDADLSIAEDRLQRGDVRYFAAALKARDQWRLFERFRSRAVCLDIETTGMGGADITVVGLYGNETMTTLIQGDSLSEERLASELARYDVLITFFGSVFDVPCLRARYPRLRLDHAHVDLCFVAKRLGITGGLKRIEREAGIERPADLAGLDGWDAVRLWQLWRRGDAAALDRLIAYNAADTRNLAVLADSLCPALAERYGIGGNVGSDSAPA
jgi:uncharacterized protein YprB with RNaseH-like and TPR domain